MKLQIAIIVAAYSCSVSGQGTFQNLDFEQANPVVMPGGFVTAASGLPSWTVTIGGVQQAQITENSPSAGSPWVMLVGPGDLFPFPSPIDGSYSLLLQQYGGFPQAAAISQVGVIPDGTESLYFEAQPPNAQAANGPLNILIGTQSVPYTELGTGPNYILYGANISAWAGQTEELTISDPVASGNWEIDDISFSPTAITPEPSPLALMGIAGLLSAFYRRFAPKRP